MSKKVRQSLLEEKKVPSQCFVSRSFRDKDGEYGPTEADTEVIAVRTFVSEPAKVSLVFGLTLNLGNYESARLEVGLTCPCYTEEIDEAYAFAHRWVEKRLKEEAQQIRKTSDDHF